MKSFLQFLKESQIIEGKQEYLKKYSSEPDIKTVIDKFWIIRQRLKNPENDIDYWIKKPFYELKQFILNFDTSKNKKVRQQDRYVKDAEKWGAIMFGKFGSYEAWFIPTHKAAIQLGRFYKNVSTHWCISTDEPIYFDNQYSDYEFVFLISDDKSLKDKQKLALQINSRTFELKGVWDISDKNIINVIHQFEKNIINNVLVEFKKLNRSRNDNITKTIIDKNKEEIIKNTNLILNNILKNITTIEQDTIPDKYKKYLTNVVIPNNITSIGYGAFSNCKSLKEIFIPDSVTSIGRFAFSNCQLLISIAIPDSVTSIGEYAFSSCESLTSIIIPNSVISIGDSAFTICKSLKKITIPNSVTSIGKWSFSHCRSLVSITIPDSVTSIGEYAFSSCKTLTQVIFSSNSPLLNNIKNGENEKWGLKLEQIFIKK